MDMKKSFEVIDLEELGFFVMAVETNILNSEGDNTCVSGPHSKEEADHICGKLNDVLGDA